jgi:hypothetical protein
MRNSLNLKRDYYLEEVEVDGTRIGKVTIVNNIQQDAPVLKSFSEP